MGATINIPSIVTDNLVFCVDPQNYRSYIGSGTSVTDLSTNAETCTLTGGTGYSAPAFTFDGVNDYVDCDNALTNVASDTAGSIEMWVKPTDAIPASTKVLWSVGDTDASEFIYFHINTSGILNADCAIAGTFKWKLATDASPFSDGVWEHIALVQDGTSPVIYVDGVAVSQTFSVTTDKSEWITDGSGLDNMRVGNQDYGNFGVIRHFEGSIGVSRYYNTDLSAAQVLQNYNATKDIYL